MNKDFCEGSRFRELAPDEIDLVSGGIDNEPWLYTPTPGGIFLSGANYDRSRDNGALTNGYIYTTESRPEMTSGTIPQARFNNTSPPFSR